MASQDARESASQPKAPAMSSGKRPMGATPRSAEELRRSDLNMEKMVKKNVMGAVKPGSLKRGRAIVALYLKNKDKQQGGGGAANGGVGGDGGDDRSAKRRKSLPISEDAVDDSEVAGTIGASAATAIVRAAMSPSRRPSPIPPVTSSASSAKISLSSTLSSPQRHQHVRSNPMHLLSPARVRASTSVNVSSPAPLARGSKPSEVMTSPMRAIRNGTMASPMRRPGQFLSPPRIRRTTGSPRKPLFQEEDGAGSASSASGDNGAPEADPRGGRPTTTAPMLESALDQIDLRVASAKATAAPAKSPFLSFQSKVGTKPRVGPSMAMTSPTADGTITDSTATRSGPPVVDLSSPRPTVASESITLPLPTQQAQDTEEKLPVPPKPVRSMFANRTIVGNRSMCFSTEGVASSLDVSPDGEIVVVGFTDGSVRLYEMDSNVPSDRHGYLLGHIDEESNQGAGNSNLRVKITPDGRYIFVGCRTGPRVIMSINLHHYRNEKDDAEDDFEQFQKSFMSDAKVRGFADVTKCVTPVGVQSPSRHSYYLLFGLGVGTLRLWRFVEGRPDPEWNHLYAIPTNGNTATVAMFLPPLVPEGSAPTSEVSGELSIACICEDRNLRVWPMNYSGDEKSDGSGEHLAKAHYDVPNSKDVVAIYGHYAYGISLVGEAYRFRIPLDSATATSTPRQTFDLEKFDTGGGNSKSRRSKIILESAYASDDGRVMVAVSLEGIFYYSNTLSMDPAVTPKLRIIGKSSSLNQQYKTPMKVYIPAAKSSGQSEPKSMLAVVSNPSENDDHLDGFFNVDPTEVFASRWMVPSRGNDCWVCGVRNTCHWQRGPEQQKARMRVGAVRQSQKSRNARSKVIDVSNDDGDEVHDPDDDYSPSPPRRGSKTRSSISSVTSKSAATPKSKAKAKKTISTRERPGSATEAKTQTPASESLEIASAPAATKTVTSRPRLSMAGDSTAGEDSDASVEHSQSNLAAELAHYKHRLTSIEVEWKRRLTGEIQLRRRWKVREAEFDKELQDLLDKLIAAETQVEELQAAQKDAEKRFSFEKLKAEQQSSVRARYEKICEEMEGKMGLVEDQRRLLEQTTRSLLAEVDRNVHSLKYAVGLERSECVVCKDNAAVTAVVPCGHLCFCEEDAETYRRNSTTPSLLCPVCQGELVSLLRIY